MARSGAAKRETRAATVPEKIPVRLNVNGSELVSGLVAAIGMLTEIGDIHNFASAKQLVSYAGLATSVRQSGSMIQ